MKHSSIIAGALATLAVMAVSASAQAAITLDPLPGTHDITVDLTVDPIGGGLSEVLTDISGVLPADSTLTFNYGLGTGLAGQATASSTFNTDVNPTTASASTTSPFASASAAFGFVTANLSLPLSATTVIGNTGSTAVTFETTIFAVIAGGIPTLTYTLSSVPLPPALSMFGTLLAGLFGFSGMRRRKNNVSSFAAA